MCLTQVQKNVNVLSSPSITTSLYILVPHKYIANDYFQSNNIFSSPHYALVLFHVLPSRLVSTGNFPVSFAILNFVNTAIIFDHSKVGSWAENPNCFLEPFLLLNCSLTDHVKLTI